MNLPAKCQSAYIKFLVLLGDYNSLKFDEALKEKILLDLDHLHDGISLRLLSTDPYIMDIYHEKQAQAMNILLYTENRLALISKSSKKVRSALFKALWAGYSHKFPIYWQ